MDHLPDELLLKIIKYINIQDSKELEKIKDISNRFRRLCNDHTILLGIIKKLENRKKCRKYLGTNRKKKYIQKNKKKYIRNKKVEQYDQVAGDCNKCGYYYDDCYFDHHTKKCFCKYCY